MNDAVLILLGAGTFILLAVISFILVLLMLAVRRLSQYFVAIDRALVPFGQSPLGNLVHQAAQAGRTYVDQPTDSLVIQIAALLNSLAFVARAAQKAGIELTPDRVALWGRAVFDALGKLTNGVPEGEHPTL